MADVALLDRVVLRLGDDLGPGELARHAVAAFEYGGARRIVIDDLKGPGTFMIAAAMRAIEGQDNLHPTAELIPVPKRCIVALTSHRLIIFGDRAIFSHTPTTKVQEVLISDITWVGSPIRAGRLTIADRVIVGLADGRCLGWEFPRLSIDAGQRLMTDLVAVLGASGTDGDPGAVA